VFHLFPLLQGALYDTQKIALNSQIIFGFMMNCITLAYN